MEDNGDKTLDPTPHRREQAREQGQIARSQDLGNAALLAAGALVLYALGGSLADQIGRITVAQLGGEAWLRADSSLLFNTWVATLGNISLALLPIMGLLFVAAAAVNIFQVGFLFMPEKLAPDLSRIDPLAGFGRIFSVQGVARLAFGMLKVVLVGVVAYRALIAEQDTVIGLAQLSLIEIAATLFDVLYRVTLKTALALLILALFDYAVQWWKQEQDLRMTMQEMKDEMKQMQGDPQIAARRRQVQRQLVLNRMKTAVPKADVVITNPTELAIAIQYDPLKMAAPIVVAKGAGLLAARIRTLALEHGIPIVERKPLAQALYKEVDLNHPIPTGMFAAVSEVLAYVYTLKGKKFPDAA